MGLVLLNTLGVTLFLAQVIIIFLVGYQVVISIVGLILNILKRGKNVILENVSYKKFAILVCAHNEQDVIGQIVLNLQGINYPKDKYDIYVICDNCSDDTASIVKSMGGIAMERNDVSKRGKGHGLEWMFEELWKLEEKGVEYDGIVVLDADNLVSPNFLTVMNLKLHEGHKVVQGYLDSKNPSDTWITKSYAFSYWSTNRIFQLVRQYLGLSSQLGGTGMVFEKNIIKEMGWGATSLTEDLEFTARYVMKTGNKVGWAHDAVIYDEKPLKMKASFVQRIRWMQGHMDCMMRYTMILLNQFIKTRKIIYFDIAIYLVQPIKILLTTFCGIFVLLSFFNVFPEVLSKYVINNLWWVITLLLSYFIVYLGILLEGKWKISVWMFWAYFFSISWVPVLVYAIFKKDKTTWSHTKHNRTLSEEELFKITATVKEVG